MLDETCIKRSYKLQYVNKKGEDLEVIIERGSSFSPLDEWEEVLTITVRPKGNADYEIEGSEFLVYEKEAMDQFHKELKRSEEVMKSENANSKAKEGN